MSVTKLRAVVAARRTIGDAVVDTLIPSERDAHAAAVSISKCCTSVLEAHASAGLSMTTGSDVIEMLVDALSSSARSRAQMGQVHARLREIASEHGITYASVPDCPPNEPGNGFLGLPGLGG